MSATLLFTVIEGERVISQKALANLERKREEARKLGSRQRKLDKAAKEIEEQLLALIKSGVEVEEGVFCAVLGKTAGRTAWKEAFMQFAPEHLDAAKKGFTKKRDTLIVEREEAAIES